ncbi:hypothetical protein LSS_22135 [Leptospira santarosai serovar Shermani str. LT 821]|uniref:Uncharacterized protein n=1 Tax=Leptospira santarosai serovar Shermani str. LT 821 TaxID=758847 RepID=A0A097ESP4_9LEPT|nr:hypothetical protein LSS_22135 [Leptospira santarosai serovar Shermani str. LT 821]
MDSRSYSVKYYCHNYSIIQTEMSSTLRILLPKQQEMEHFQISSAIIQLSFY